MKITCKKCQKTAKLNKFDCQESDCKMMLEKYDRMVKKEVLHFSDLRAKIANPKDVNTICTIKKEYSYPFEDTDHFCYM